MNPAPTRLVLRKQFPRLAAEVEQLPVVRCGGSAGGQSASDGGADPKLWVEGGRTGGDERCLPQSKARGRSDQVNDIKTSGQSCEHSDRPSDEEEEGPRS